MVQMHYGMPGVAALSNGFQTSEKTADSALSLPCQLPATAPKRKGIFANTAPIPQTQSSSLKICADFIGRFGEPVGARTRDLLIKSQLLYQLSYRPTQEAVGISGCGAGQVKICDFGAKNCGICCGDQIWPRHRQKAIAPEWIRIGKNQVYRFVKCTGWATISLWSMRVGNPTR